MSATKNFQTEKKWVYPEQTEVLEEWKGINPEIQGILINRGIKTEVEANNFLSPDYEKLKDPFLLPDVEKAVTLIISSIDNKEKIAIYGDYDVDGITSTALLLDFFERVGADVVSYIPSRENEGYGLNIEAIDTLIGQGVNLIITVDCGSSAIDEVKYAKEKGLRVVVTDHHGLMHENGEEVIPEADAVINPKRSSSNIEDELAGVGVAFYLVRALQTKCLDKFPKGQEKWLLDLVALGTICDVVPLVGDNRILASFGLKVLQKTKRAGLKSIATTAEIDLEAVSSYHIGFLIGPRLNASGRMETAHKALGLLTTKDENEAAEFANYLNNLNHERQELTSRILEEAREYISGLDQNRRIFLLSSENWPAGVIGIVASRLVDEYGKPVLIMEEKGSELKGSARSIKAFNIIEALEECKEHLVQFGGHAFAAGFKLNKEHFILLDKQLVEIAGSKIKLEDIIPEVSIDRVLNVANLNKKLVQDIKNMEPFGNRNPRPVFVLKDAQIVDFKLVGNPACHLKLTLNIDEVFIKGIAFNYGEIIDFKEGELADVACTIEENTWRENTSIEFKAIDIHLNK